MAGWEDQAEVEWWSRSLAAVLTCSWPRSSTKSAHAACRLSTLARWRGGFVSFRGSVELGSGSRG